MKKLNEKSKRISVALAILGSTALLQACGASSGSSDVAPVIGLPAGSYSSGLDMGLASACAVGSAASIQSMGNSFGLSVFSAVSTTAKDGASVCKLTFQETYGNTSYGLSRAFLGPNSGSLSGLLTTIGFDPYDQAIFSVAGSESTAMINFGCGSDPVAPALYGSIPGVPPELLNGSTIQVPQNGGGFLSVGLNQSQGSGVMCVEVQAMITRCLDSSGVPHPCS